MYAHTGYKMKRIEGKASFTSLNYATDIDKRRTRPLSRSRIKSLDIENNITAGRASAGGSCRLLRRQFSLDRTDEPSSSSFGAPDSTQHRPMPRLFKQNSAGAANDLERIEEVPNTPIAGQNYRNSNSVSLSVESLR